MTEKMKQALLDMMKATPADSLKNDLDTVRDVLYTLLNPVIDEIIAYDNSDEENEAKIESLFQKKDMIEQSIGVLNGIIVTLKKEQNQ
tara:strand:+ start:186 stop:449 length:264 start_codon:yes stop_codon:yes gene_type:complete